MLATIARYRTLAEAAAALRITPSALTHRIREAERRLGVQLYKKHGRVLRPNAAAEILAPTAERLLHGLRQAERVAIASIKGVWTCPAFVPLPAEQARVVRLLAARITTSDAGLAVDLRHEGLGAIAALMAPAKPEMA